jgi:hypothetical protein
MSDRNKILFRKINREIQHILDTFGNYTMEEDPIENNITLTVKHDNRKYAIKFYGTYPFTKPEVFYNDLEYHSMLIFNQKYFRNYLEQLCIRCLCCESLMCSNNWTVTTTIMNVFNEIINNRKLVLRMFQSYYVSEICLQNNIYCYELHNLILSFM